MIALFFEVTPAPGQETRYLEIASGLRPELETSGGVTFLDRFRSLSRPRTMLSHQIWTDEASLARWRANGQHYGAQTLGRRDVFEDYRLRVGTVVAWRSAAGRVETVEPGVPYNDPARQPQRWLVVVRSAGQPFSATEAGESWQSVYTEASFAFVTDVPDRAAGLALVQRAAADPCVSAAQLSLVSRDYGMFDRGEAPQYFPSKPRA